MRCLARRAAVGMVMMMAGSLVLAAAAEPAGTVAGEPSPTLATWKAVAASGPVEARPGEIDDAWAPLRRGDRLDPLSLVRTGRRGRATLTRQGDIVMVDPDSQVELPDAALSDDGSPVIQNSGSVIYEVDRRRGRDFRVVTPFLVAGVKGTVFMVTVTDSSASVTVEEGIVEVTSRSTGESLDVLAGESIFLDARVDAEMDHVSLRTKADRESDANDRQTRKLARADLRRLAHAVSQRDEIVDLGEPDPADELEAPANSPVEGLAPDPLEHELYEEDLDDRGLGLPEEELSEDLSGEEARKTQPKQTPVQP